MAGNVEMLQDRYARFAQGDVEGAVAEWTDDFVWDGPNSDDLPGAGKREGREAALQALAEGVGAWDEFELHPDEFHEDGDTVVVLAHQHVSKEGRSGKLPVVHVWRFRDGEPCRLALLTDTLQGARILGLV